MDGTSTKEGSLELEPEENHRPFSVVLAPAALVAVQNQQHGGCAALIRHLHVPQHSSSNTNTEGGRARKQSPARRSSPLSGVVVAVRAQPCVLHLFRGRRLCRVVEFPSPISDFAGVPAGCPRLSRFGLLCVAVCRDGTSYALPIAEVLDAERGDTSHQDTTTEGRTGVVAGSVGGNNSVGGDGGSAESTAVRKRSSARPSSTAPLGIFEDLAPTILGRDPSSPPEQAPHQQQCGKGSGSSGSSNSSGSSGSGGSVGGLVLRAQERWAVFSHLGARTVVACSGLTAAAVAGIIDHAAVYGLAGRQRERGTTPVGRCLASLDGVDGAAPTTSCMVWMEDGRGASGDGKGFSLPSRVFRALFGAELALPQSTPSSSPSSSPPPPPTHVNDATNANHDAASSEPPMQPSVILLGDAAGGVRWAPARPHRGVSGGVLANLATSVIGVFPQLNAASRAVGVLVVGADGAVLSLTAESAPPPPVSPRKRSRRDAAGESDRHDRGGNVGGEATSSEDSRRGSAHTIDPPSVCQRALKLPFPVTSACSAPGFLVHCHAGALFASAILEVESEETSRRDRQERASSGGSLGRSSASPALGRPRRLREGPSDRSESPGFLHGAGAAHSAPLHPVRLPLPCDAVGVTVAVLAEDEADAAADLSSATLRTLVVSLSARGRVVGFVAPRSVEELGGWALDTGRGGVRVGGTAGVEHRVRCHLKRLSSVGKQCAALSAESVERDREIRTLRGATGILPPLVRRSARRRRNGAGQHLREASPPLEHSVSMTPDAKEAASFADWWGGAGGSDALRVRLCVRLQWPARGGCSRSLPAAEKEGDGRWFVVTRIVAEGDGGSSGTAGGEGWAWSTSSLLSITSLRQGRPWSSSVALWLPSARPVTATSWLQFSFGVEGSSECDGGRSGGPLDKAAGACVELGSSRFDLLDWGVKLSSVPGSAVAVRGAARGRGAYFCGPDLAIAEICGAVPSNVGGGGGGGGGGTGIASGDNFSWKTAPAAWRSFQLRVASPRHDAGALLGLLMPSSAPPTSGANGKNGAPPPAGGATSEIAVRVAGQVAVIRASDYGVGMEVGVGAGVGAAGGAGGQTDSRTVEISVTCSHEAMSPLVREALLRRASALTVLNGWGGGAGVGDGGGGGSGKANAGTGEAFGSDLLARGDAATRLTRQIHPFGRAIGDLGDAARALGAARASDGPSVETAKEALVLMYRVGEVYQALRRLQEGAIVVV